jgi:hypothetical protein
MPPVFSDTSKRQATSLDIARGSRGRTGKQQRLCRVNWQGSLPRLRTLPQNSGNLAMSNGAASNTQRGETTALPKRTLPKGESPLRFTLLRTVQASLTRPPMWSLAD